MKGDRPLGGEVSPTRRAFSAVAISAVVAVAVSAPMALRVLDDQGDDESTTSTTIEVDVSIAGQTTVQPAPPESVPTPEPASPVDTSQPSVPPSVLGITEERDQADTNGG
ncbi:MAG: hypothetical protein ACR2OH_03615 [Microthrixaceae bacterium]